MCLDVKCVFSSCPFKVPSCTYLGTAGDHIFVAPWVMLVADRLFSWAVMSSGMMFSHVQTKPLFLSFFRTKCFKLEWCCRFLYSSTVVLESPPWFYEILDREAFWIVLASRASCVRICCSVGKHKQGLQPKLGSFPHGRKPSFAATPQGVCVQCLTSSDTVSSCLMPHHTL